MHFCKIALAKYYASKTQIKSAGPLNDKVLPFYAQQQLLMPRALTDRGTSYCCVMDQHDYQLYLAIKDITGVLLGDIPQKTLRNAE